MMASSMALAVKQLQPQQQSPSAVPPRLNQVEKITNEIENGGDHFFCVGEKKYGGITGFLKPLSPGLGKIISEAEAEGKDSSVLDIDERDAEHFGLLLKAINSTHKWTEKKEDVIPLMVMAEKYETKFVVALCKKYLDETGITGNNAVTIYQDSQNFKVSKYKDMAWTFITQNAKEVVAEEDFKNITKTNLEKLMEHEVAETIANELVAAFRKVKRDGNLE